MAMRSLQMGLIERVDDTQTKFLGFRVGEATTLSVALVALWSLTHHYRGLTGDGELYAMQAFARVIPQLGNDIFLRSASQDDFSIFSRVYAYFIGIFGLQRAAILLTVVCKVWFYGAAWALVRIFVTRNQAYLAVAFLIIVQVSYGAYDVFRYSEDFLTARSVAEGLVVTSLALHCRGRKLIGFLIAVSGLVFHPLMALPGILLLCCLSISLRWCVFAAVAGIVAAIGIACYASMTVSRASPLTILDPSWLEIVRERSQFLFINLWSIHDWTDNSRPLLSLAITLLASRDARITRLCVGSLLVGITGCAIAAVAGTIGPVAILLQGQTWRWLWIPTFISIALLVLTVLNLLRDARCGPLCAVLLVVGWTFSLVNCLVCFLPALLLWSGRRHLRAGMTRPLLWAALVMIVIASLWAAVASWGVLNAPSLASIGAPLMRARADRNLQFPAVVAVCLIYTWIGQNRSVVALISSCVALAATNFIALPKSLIQFSRTPLETSEFHDWVNLIPPGANVYVVPEQTSAAFVWFTLERPSYLSLDQSAGVVFSRETAVEVERRSQILLPLTSPDWKLLSAMEAHHKGARKTDAVATPLTKETLEAVCRDPQLGFVIAQPDIGFKPVKHSKAGKWKDWNLYDCSHVRSVTDQ